MVASYDSFVETSVLLVERVDGISILLLEPVLSIVTLVLVVVRLYLMKMWCIYVEKILQ